VPFLSLLDDRAKPKGSRDPLGFELVWTHYGRQVIGNLTTVTSSLSNFAVALLGFRWANEINANVAPNEKQRRTRETFLRYEQLTGYVRYLADDKSIMGITRVTERMENPPKVITLGMAAHEQILSDQASYGLWGLYSTATTASGLVTDEIRMPTPLGNNLAEKIERYIDKPAMISFLASNKPISAKQLQKHAQSFVEAINKKPIRTELLHALMNGGDRNAVQSDLWRITQELANKNIQVKSLAGFISLVRQRSQNAMLIERLDSIQAVERVLVAANNLFHFCRQKDGESLESVLKSLDDRYSYNHLPIDPDLTNVPKASYLLTINSALRNNDTTLAIKTIFELNKIVMEQRSGAPWVELESSQKIRVRVPTETYSLISQEQLETDWDYEYFISSFLRIASQAKGGQWKVL
jgi:hypothetical protein